MTSRGKVVLVGLSPDVVDFEKWTHLTSEKLMHQLESDVARLNGLGFEAKICLIDRGETAGDVVLAELQATRWDAVLVGAGVRNDPEQFLLFERLINLIHEHAPQARICFNNSPDSSAEAVLRWL